MRHVLVVLAIAALALSSRLDARMAATITMSVSPNPTVWSQPATISTAMNAGATGTVTVYVNRYSPYRVAGPVSLSGGVALLTASTGPMQDGTYEMYAVYSGDSNYDPATSAVTLFVVNPPATATKILTPANGSSWPANQMSVQASVTVLPPAASVAPSGVVEFLDGGSVFAPATVLGGVISGAGFASASLETLSPGVHQVTARFTSNRGVGGNFALLSSTSPPVVVTILPGSGTQKRPAYVNISASANPATWWQPITWAVTFPPGATGSIILYDGSVPWVGTATSEPQVGTTPLGAGPHTITAVYGGDAVYAQATSSPTVLNVNPSNSAASMVPPFGNQHVTIGQPVTLSAIAQLDPSGLFFPGGSIQFLDGAQVIATADLLGGGVTTTTSNLAPGVHSLSARYTGAVNPQGYWNVLPSPTSAAVSLTVDKLVSSVAASAAPNPAIYGQTIDLLAQVGPSPSAGFAPPSGSVAFQEAGKTLGTAAVVSGVARLSLSNLTAGTHLITASYSGDNAWAGATAAITVAIQPAATVTSLRLSIGSAGQAIATATVAGAGTATGPPTGSVQFLDAQDRSTLATAALSNGVATAPLPAGKVMRSIVASYAGDANFQPSSSKNSLAIANAASYDSSGIAADEIACAFNSAVSSGSATASPPLPTSLNGVSLSILDSAGNSNPVSLYGVFASAGQIDFVVPDQLPPGLGMLTITGPGGSESTVINVVGIAPGIFSADGSGHGAAAAQFLRVRPDLSQSVQDAAAYDPGTQQWIPTPVDLGTPDDRVFLILFGTGIRGADDGTVAASIGGISVPVQFSGAQSAFPGLDQVNLELPHSLAGAGTVEVVLSADGQKANTVLIAIQ